MEPPINETNLADKLDVRRQIEVSDNRLASQRNDYDSQRSEVFLEQLCIIFCWGVHQVHNANIVDSKLVMCGNLHPKA
jgi:hypothetical protein